MNKELRQLLQNEYAVNVVTGHILNFAILVLITGSIIGAFYIKAEESSMQAMRVDFTDLGSQIARDITNMYTISEYSSNININIVRDIPLTIGGKGYRIILNNATSDKMASISIIEGSFSGYEIITTLNSIDSKINVSGTMYSGSGRLNIGLTKDNLTDNSTKIWIR